MIKGAFMSGLVDGFATSFTEGIKERQAKADELIDMQMDAARRTAPKLAQSMADLKDAEVMMQEMGTEFGVTPEEFIALAQSYDIKQVYNAVAKVQAQLPQGQKLDKQKFLGSLNIRDGAKLPENMSAEQALESIYLGYARNVSQKPDDTSDIHKAKSWGKALQETLMLDPRASAEDQLSAMSYMGYSVDDLLRYQAAMGTKYQPLPGVTRDKACSITTTDYDASRDYESSINLYDRVFSRTVGLDPELSPTMQAEALRQSGYGPDEKTLAAKNARLGATAIADLEMELGYSGLFEQSYLRTPIIAKLSNSIDNREEMEAFIEAQKNGRAKNLIMESIQKSGALTDEYIEAILTGAEPKVKDPISIGEREAESEDAKFTIGDQPEGLGAEPTGGVVNMEGTGSEDPTTGDATVDAIFRNAKQDDEPEIDKITFGGLERAKTQRRIDDAEAYREAASKVTYEEYKNMSDKEKEAAGLPTVPVKAGEAFGMTNPKKYFKGGIRAGDAETEDLIESALKISLELEDSGIDMEALRGEDGEEIIKEWMKRNNIEINDRVLEMVKMQLRMPLTISRKSSTP